jgi:hypothetical protein
MIQFLLKMYHFGYFVLANEKSCLHVHGIARYIRYSTLDSTRSTVLSRSPTISLTNLRAQAP